ncbi:MAG: peptide deformylase [Cyanobacteria bacterium WB6_1B_304]|jgi:peptide deformylase|nr:peptide deformylase [Cyanobacteria bacterium WB6_1B_304]
MSTELAPVEKKKSDHPPYQVHYLGDRVLRQPAKRVNKVDAEVRQTIRQMLQTMYSLDGIGLAAPQVGIHKQIVVVDIHPDDGATAPLIMINPEIHGYSQDLSIMEEGCLSIPGVFLQVRRPQAIQVTFKDEYGRLHTIEDNELLARVIQHELDHLHGVMFVDRVENPLVMAQQLSQHGFSAKSVKPVSKS